MKEITIEISYMEEKMKIIENELERLKSMVPKGVKLRAVRYGNTYQYFVRKRGDSTSGKYIKKEDRMIAVMLAQIEYDEKLYELIKKRIASMEKLKTKVSEDPFDAALNKMTPGKSILIKPHYVSDKAYIQDWLHQIYEKSIYKEDSPEFYTRQGLRVRSKSEIIIADILDEVRLPFLYEKPLILKSGTVHPDFTLLDIRERREIYWEHFGMMDDMDYRNNAFFKIRNYESSGYYQNDSLIWTLKRVSIL